MSATLLNEYSMVWYDDVAGRSCGGASCHGCSRCVTWHSRVICAGTSASKSATTSRPSHKHSTGVATLPVVSNRTPTVCLYIQWRFHAGAGEHSPPPIVAKKSKVFPYSLPSVGPGADPGVQAFSPQVTWSESRHRPGSRLPLLSARRYPRSFHQMALPVNGSTNLIPALLLIYRPRKDERLSWPSWLTGSGWFTHISGHPSAAGRAQDRESSPVRDRRSTTVLLHQS